MSEHTIKSFDSDLSGLKAQLSEMGGLAEALLQRAMTALTKHDTKLADEVIADDEKIDALEVQIEERAVLTIARRQPVARDLRDIMVTIRIASDLERIGDLAKNVAKRAHAVSERMPRSFIVGLERMGQLCQQQVKMVLDAYAADDAEKAMEVWRHDEDIDALYNSIFRELLTYMMEDPRMIGACTHLLFATKNIERIGDHATNIAENVYYLVNGKTLREERPKKDKTSTMSISGKGA